VKLLKLLLVGSLSLLLLTGCGAPPNPAGDLGNKIVQLMDKYLPELGLTIITEEICAIVTESSLQKASEELSQLNPQTWTTGVGHPSAPSGSFRAEFSRDAQFLRNQYLLIYVSDEHKYCEAKLENVPGL
jgi:hypothetical protein